MPISAIHDRLAISAMLFSAVCALWGLVNYVRKQPVTGGYWGGLVILQILMVVEVVLGIVFALSGNGQLLRPIVHILYGATMVISLPAAYIYTGGKDTRRENLIYALVCLWLLFIVERGVSTGREGLAVLFYQLLA
jgi:hypothetical protein